MVQRRNPDRAAMAARAQMLRDNGMSTRQIAEDMDLSPSTIHRYLDDPTGEKTRVKSRKASRIYRRRFTRAQAEERYNHMEVPLSYKITERPVWRRRQARIFSKEALPPPTDEEIRDAISILGDKRLENHGKALWFDAFLIMDEEGR